MIHLEVAALEEAEIPLDRLLEGRASLLLCYPRFTGEEAERRLEELRGLGVDALILEGRHEVEGLRVLGKGHVSIAVEARVGDEVYALKIRRTDADRESFRDEAEKLRMANDVGVGPRLVRYTDNFLLMELIRGEYLPDWIEALSPGDEELLRSVLKSLLEKARKLDEIGLDHGELSRAHRHIIVSGGEPRLIDFESASTDRRVSNITSLTQYLFINRRMRRLISRILKPPEIQPLIEALKQYKREPSDENYRRILEVCSL
ncbi:serine/threonine protein kinase [Candidatus Bathyarchaeota archaeon]|nr:MAG: serine/threonine protein kinase [Candidatus Bathyarchaeota archaeon]